MRIDVVTVCKLPFIGLYIYKRDRFFSKSCLNIKYLWDLFFFLSSFNLFSINIFVLRLKENVLLSLNGKITGTRIYDIYFKNIETVAN